MPFTSIYIIAEAIVTEELYVLYKQVLYSTSVWSSTLHYGRSIAHEVLVPLFLV